MEARWLFLSNEILHVRLLRLSLRMNQFCLGKKKVRKNMQVQLESQSMVGCDGNQVIVD